MRCTRYLLSGLVAVGNVLVAADQTQWMTEWSTTTCWSTKEAETVWSTQYSTTTCWSTSTPPPVTVYDTITSSKTVYDTVTTSTTVEVPYTTTSVVEKDFTTTVYSSYAQVVTSVETSVATVTKIVVSTLTVPSLSIATATATATSVNVVPGKGYTSTVIIQNTKTITQACVAPAPTPTPTPTLTGLVVCSSRITNEQGYVPPTPLPSTWLWGCPPGHLCKPKQIGCNFEAGVYASTYICAPEDCIVAENVTSIDQFGGPYAEDYDSTCPFFVPDDNYPILNPTLFGLTYSEFAVASLGIYPSSCPPAAPPPPPVTTTTTTTTTPVYVPPTISTTTTQWLPWTTSSAPPPPVSSSTTQWLPWTYSSSYVPPPSSSTWSSYVPPAPVVSSSTWGDWAQSSSAEAYSSGWDHPSATTSWPHGVTPRALVRRAGTVPPACQPECDNCAAVGAHDAKVYSVLCDPNGSFIAASSKCQLCISANKQDTPKQVQLVLTDLNQFFDVCSNPPKTTTASPQGVSTSPPAPKSTATPTTTPKVTPSTTSPKPPPTTTLTTKSPSTPTTSIPATTPTTTATVVVTTPPTTPPSSTTPGSVTTSSVVPVSQISDGQPQAPTSIASYSGTGNAAAPHATQRPAAVMGVVVVAVVIAMV